MNQHILKTSITIVFLTTVASAMFLFGHLSMAAPPRHQGPDIDQLTAALELTDEQASQVAAILEDARAQGQVLMSEHRASGDRSAARADMEALRSQTNARLAEVLDAEQMDRFEAMRPERRGNRRQATRGGSL